MKVSKILQAARKKIEDPANWTKHAPARDSDGCLVDPKNSHATCWCTVGAFYSVTPDYDDFLKTVKFVNTILPDVYEKISDFNDHPETTHDQVLSLFDRAIEKAKPEE